jgi:hypothetical protein
LERWHLEVCGGLIFVCLNSPTQTLAQHISELSQRGMASVPEGWRMRFSDGENLVAKFQAQYLVVMREAQADALG